MPLWPVALFLVLSFSAGLIPAGHTGGMNHGQHPWENQWDTMHVCVAGCGRAAAWFTDLVPPSQSINLSIILMCQAGRPTLSYFSSLPGPWDSLPSTRTCCSFHQHVSNCFFPYYVSDQLCPVQTRVGGSHACVWSPHPKWLLDASCNSFPADYPMSYCFCHFSKLPLFCLHPSLPALMSWRHQDSSFT